MADSYPNGERRFRLLRISGSQMALPFLQGVQVGNVLSHFIFLTRHLLQACATRLVSSARSERLLSGQLVDPGDVPSEYSEGLVLVSSATRSDGFIPAGDMVTATRSSKWQGQNVEPMPRSFLWLRGIYRTVKRLSAVDVARRRW